MGKRNKEVVVVGGDHYNTLWVARSLGSVDFCPTVIVVNPHATHSFVAKSKYVKTAYVVKNEAAMLELLERLSFPERTVLFSSSDGASDMIDRHYDLLKDRYILPNCGGVQGRLSYWMDKKRMTDLAIKTGFNVPWSRDIDFKGTPDLKGVSFPCILKPLKSSLGSKFDFFVCYTEKELGGALERLKAQGVPCLLQEFIKPDFEISILCMRSRSCGVNLIPGLLHKLGTCQSVQNMGMPTYAYVDKDIDSYIDVDAVNRFLNYIDYDGLYSIEYFVSGGKAYFLEINLRVDGDLFVYTKGGVNMPALWAKMNLGERVEKRSMDVSKTYGMTEISYLKYLRVQDVMKGLVDWWKTDCYSIFSWTDPLPFIYKFIYAVK